MSAPTPPRAVLFDLDGTLVDSLPTVAAAMAEAMREHGFHVDPAEVVPRIGPPMNLLVEEITGCPAEQADAVNARFMDLYYGEFIRGTRPMPGAEALLDRLAAAGVPLAVLTNKVTTGGRQMVEIMGWTPRFRAVVGRDAAARPKPAPDGAEHALRLLGVPAGAAAIVGDTEYDMGCGSAAGVALVIGVIAERPAEALRASGATHVCGDLDAVGALLLDGRLPAALP